MISGLKRYVVRNIVSPVSLALISYGIFLFAWVFPPQVYQSLMSEPDYIFLYPKALIFCSICVAAFIFGATTSRNFVFSTAARPRSPSMARLRGLPFVLPLIVFTIVGCGSLAVVGLKTQNLAFILLQQGQELKQQGQADLSVWNRLVSLNPVHVGIIWWFAYRLRQADMSRSTMRMMKALLWFSVTVAIANTVAQIDRTALMPILVGLMVVYQFTSKKAQKGELLPLLKSVILGVATVLALFVLLSLLRGSFIGHAVGGVLLGYTASSYNRLAAVLNGSLTYFYTGNLQDLCRFCSNNYYFNKIVPFGVWFNIPDARMSWLSDFSSTGAAGLASGYTFASAFAFVYRDIGWWTPLYFLGQGVITGWAWRSFQNGRAFGLMVYPWCAFTVLFWFGWNVFLNDSFFYLSGAAIVMARYESLLSRGRTADLGVSRVLVRG